MSYRVLVLPDRPAISLPVLRKVRELVAAGATVIGTKPETATGLQGFPNSDEEVRSISAALWGSAPPSPGTVIRHGAGRVVAARSARDFLISDGVRPDFEYGASASGVELDYIHRRAGESEIYFVASRSKVPSQVTCTFRVSGKQPELWDPMTGERRDLQDFRTAGGRVSVPLEFAPYGSWFVVFRRPAPALTRQAGGGSPDFPRFLPVRDMPGPWTVRFDQRWGGPASAAFPELVSWATRPERGIRFYSGTGTYSKTFDFPPIPAGSGKKLYLDLGEVRQIAEVRLNGQNLGIVWAPPFRVEITSAVRAGDNRLEIDVVNFWPNRVIGDASLPQGERLTKTNIRKLTADTPLMESGLLGPVRILQAGGPAATPRRN